MCVCVYVLSVCLFVCVYVLEKKEKREKKREKKRENKRWYNTCYDVICVYYRHTDTQHTQKGKKIKGGGETKKWRIIVKLPAE